MKLASYWINSAPILSLLQLTALSFHFKLLEKALECQAAVFQGVGWYLA